MTDEQRGAQIVQCVTTMAAALKTAGDTSTRLEGLTQNPNIAYLAWPGLADNGHPDCAATVNQPSPL